MNLSNAGTAVRDGMGYKRRDLKKSYDGGNSGTIITPDFDYNVSLGQDPEDAAQALLRHEVTHIRNPGAILSDAFQVTYDGMFDRILFDSGKEINVLNLVDQIEEMEPEGIDLVDYDDEGSYCTLKVAGVPGTITITPMKIEVIAESRLSPRQLAQMFGNTWNSIRPSATTGMLPGPE